MDLSELQNKIKYHFNNPRLLEQALTHSSHANETGGSDNERMEFFGDSLLGMVVNEYLYRNLTGYGEGDLSILKSVVVSMQTLGKISRGIGLGEYCLLGRGEELSGGRNRVSILANTFEALVAAVYLDGGLEKCREFVLRYLAAEIEKFDRETRGGEYKGLLQEIVQSEYGLKPVYKVVSASGAEHSKIFRTQVGVNGVVFGEGKGLSKKEAEKMAAKNGWEFMLAKHRSKA